MSATNDVNFLKMQLFCDICGLPGVVGQVSGASHGVQLLCETCWSKWQRGMSLIFGVGETDEWH